MARQLTQEEVIARFRAVHGDRYGYELMNYRGKSIPVNIECPIHGIFQQRPEHHWNGRGCRKCASKGIRERTLIYGVGVNDVDEKTRVKSYAVWKSMLGRCYDPNNKDHIVYDGCRVCNEWLYYSNFKKWYDANYVDGYDLDKDIIERGNKIYCPEKCRFIPHEINSLLINCKRNRGIYPVGVSKVEDGFKSSIRMYGEYRSLGVFNSSDLAFKAYKTTKESYIKAVATAYYNQGMIGQDIYQSLINWTIEITD